MFSVLTLLAICLMGIQPVLAQTLYTAEFEAEAEGTFFVAEGLPVEDWEPTFLAVGEGDCYIEGKAHGLSRWDASDNYLGFPADMKLEGELKGTIEEFELELELEFWELENAGCWLVINPQIYVASNLPEQDIETCIGYKLELENEDEELKLTGVGYLVAAMTMPDNYEAVLVSIVIDGEIFTFVFSEHPDVGSSIDIEVELDD